MAHQSLNRVRRFFERLYDKRIQRDWDRLIPVVGSEGVGKSTFILEAIWMYEEIRGHDPDPPSVLDYVVFDDRDAFRDKLLAADPGDPIAVMDAAHVLFNKDVMQPDQIEVQKSLLDVRIENYVFLLGYQDWGDIPRQLRKRRAENAFYIPDRGYVYGYNRQQLDEKYKNLDDNEWPDSALEDTFPSLEGTDLWQRFSEIDAQRKRSRLRRDDSEGEAEVTPQMVVDDILSGDLSNYVKINEFQDRAYFAKPLIKYDYPELSDQQADQVKSALGREADPADYIETEESEDEETDTQPPHVEG